MRKNGFFRKNLLLAVLFLLFACPLAAVGLQNLDGVEDILDTDIKLSDAQGGEVGQAFLKSRVYQKTSLAVLSFPKNSGNYEIKTYYFGGRYSIGELSDTMTGSGLNVKSANGDSASYFYGTPSVVTKSRDNAGSGAYRFAIAQYTGSGQPQISIGRITSDDGRIKPRDVKSLSIENTPYWTSQYATDIASGLFIGGEKTESFAIGEVYRAGSDAAKPNCNLYLRILPGEAYDNPAAATAIISLYEVSVSRYSAVRVVAGDFDGDGVASEVAVLFDVAPASGVDARYYLRIFKIKRAGGVVEIDPTPLYSQETGVPHTPDVCGHDIAAGDFDGDGRQEIAVVRSDYNSGTQRATATVEVYKHSGSGYTSDWTADADEANHAIGGVQGLFDTYTHTCGILAEAADLDGDGKDEIVWTAPLYGDKIKEGRLLLSAWGCSGSLKPREVSTILTNYKALGRDFMPQNISLVVSPLRDSINTATSRNNMAIGVAIREEGRAARFYIHGIDTNISGLVSGITNVSESSGVSFGSDAAAPVLLAADYADESLILGEPEHYVVRENMSYNVIMQTPPYHIDYIKAPWEDASASPSLQNFSYISGTRSAYESVETQDDTFKYTLGGGVSGSFGIKGTLGLDMYKVLKLSGTANVNAAMAATYDYISTSNTQRQSKSAVETNTDDAIKYFAADYHIWRYPVLGKVSEEAADPSLGDDTTMYLQYSLNDVVMETTTSGHDYDGYAPIHEEGNLFSYPVKLENTLGYPTDKKKILAGKETVNLGDVATKTELTWTQTEGTDQNLSLTGNVEGSVTMNLGAKIPVEIGILDIDVESKWSLAASAKYMPTWSTSIAKSEQLTCYLAGAGAKFSHNFADVAYGVTLNAFSDNAGALSLGYAVALKHGGGNTARLWNSAASPYVQLPDPALNLPHKWYLKAPENALQSPTWAAYNNEDAVHKMRGLRILTQDGENTGEILAPGQTYRVICRIYNYSFVPVDGVDIAFSYRAGSASTPVAIRTSRIGNIPGWDGVNENKVEIEFDWTVPADMPEGANYRLYVQIDPEDKIEEVHKNWDFDRDPAGNNRGYVNFAVVSPAKAQASARVRGNGERAFEVQLTNMSSEEFLEALSRDENVWVDGVVTYRGSEVATNVRVDVFDGDYLAGGRNVLLASKYFPAILPSTSRNFHFLLQPAMLHGRKLTIKVHGNGLPYSNDRTVTVDIPGGKIEPTGGGSSGCNGSSPSGAAAILILALASILRIRRNGC